MKNFLLGALTIIIIGVVAAGSYWFGQKNKQTENNTNIPTITVAPTDKIVPTGQVKSDLQLIKELLFKDNGWKDDGNITVTVSTNDGKYASGTVASQGGGGYFYTEKVNGEWEIVAQGNGMIFCSSLLKYSDYPNTLIPECYDQQTEKTKKR
jgi:hypothetical protein